MLITFNELNEILSNLNNRQDLSNHDILAEIRSISQELSDQLQKNINSDFEVTKGYRPVECALLHVAAEGGYLNVVKALLAHPEIEINRENQHRSTPVNLAAENCCAKDHSLDVAQALLEKGASIRGYVARYLLYSAAEEGHIGVVKVLLARPGIDVNAQDSPGPSPPPIPLYVAAEKGYVDVVKALLAYPGIDVSARDGFHAYTPLHVAAEKGHVDVVKALLAHPDIEVSIQSSYGQTPLHAAIHHLECAKLLIKHILIRDFRTEKPTLLNDHAEFSDYWTQCQNEATLLSIYDIGLFQNRVIFLNDFLTETDDVKLVSYIRNEGTLEKLRDLQLNGYREFPIFADQIQNKITEGEKKMLLHDIVEERVYLIKDDAPDKPIPNSSFMMKKVNQFLDHDSRKNLVRASLKPNPIFEQMPSSHVEQPNVEQGLPKGLNK